MFKNYKLQIKNLRSTIYDLSPKTGFTLIELLVVIGIIGILVGIATSSFITAQKQGRDAKRKADLEQMRQALETYRSENGTYPAATSTLTPDYITTLPTDPKSYTYYYSQDSATTYTLCAALEITPATTTCGSASCGTSISCNYSVNNP